MENRKNKGIKGTKSTKINIKYNGKVVKKSMVNKKNIQTKQKNDNKNKGNIKE